MFQVLISKAWNNPYVTWFPLVCELGSVFGASQTLMYIGMSWNPVKTELLIGGSGRLQVEQASEDAQIAGAWTTNE